MDNELQIQSAGGQNPVSTGVSTPGGLWQHPDTGRWYWRVQLEGKRHVIPMKSKGARHATKAKSIAGIIMRAMWKDMKRTYAPLPKVAEYWIGEFRTWNGVRSSARQVESNVRVVQRFVREEGIVRVHEIDVQRVVGYLGRLKGVTARTVQMHRNALHLFCRFLIIREELALNPTDAVPVATPPRQEPRYLTDRGVEILLRRVERKCPEILLAVQVALWAGPRLSSLRALKWSHVGEKALTVPLTKTKRYTHVPYDRMDPRLKEVLTGGRGKMFAEHDPTWWNRKLRMATGLMPVFGETRGPGGQWHLLRETWAVNLAREGATLWELMRWGGWRSPQVVMRYVNVAQASG